MSINASIMIFIHRFAFDTLVLLSGLISKETLAANVIIQQVYVALSIRLFYGFSDATCTIIGNQIGENNVKLAWKNFKVILIFNVIVNGGIALILFFEKETFTHLFVKDQPEVSGLLIEIFPILAATFAGNLGCFFGVIFALGVPQYAVIPTFISQYAVLVPASALLAFKFDLGLHGLCIGGLVGVYVIIFTYLLIVMCINWQEIADGAQKRIERDTIETSYEAIEEFDEEE